MEDFDSSLLPKSGYLPTQWDRQVDELDSPGLSSGGGVVAVIYPYDVISAGTSAFTVQPGTLNGLLSTNYNSTFTLSLSTTYYLTLSATASNGQITGATLSPKPEPIEKLSITMPPGY